MQCQLPFTSVIGAVLHNVWATEDPCDVDYEQREQPGPSPSGTLVGVPLHSPFLLIFQLLF